MAVGALAAFAGVAAATVTGVGPLANYIMQRRDHALLGATLQRALGSGAFHLVDTTGGQRLFCRWTVGGLAAARHKVPVVIPNGLGATLMTTAKLHEALEAAGFAVLSFDRPGVGYSSPNARGVDRPQTVADCVADMRDVMAHFLRDGKAPSEEKVGGVDQKWILVGPSMGAIVCQCFMAAHPSQVAAFVSLDGFPHPFAAQRAHFLKASGMYVAAGYLGFTGALRLPVAYLARTLFPQAATQHFPAAAMQAEMSQPGFWSNMKREFVLMMDLAAEASAQWGAASILKLPADVVDTLARMAPTCNGDYRPATAEWVTLPRASAELGDDWASAENVAAARSAVLQLLPLQQQQPQQQAAPAQASSGPAAAPLLRVVRDIPVAIMSARSYDYPGGDWYLPEMRRTAAAEHALFHAVGADGMSVRYVFPREGHDKLFQRVDVLALCVEHVHRCLLEQEQQQRH